MKTILLPTDFSENSLMAADFAVEYLCEKGTSLVLAHVYDIPRGGTSGLFYLLEELQKQAEKNMVEFLQKLEKRYEEKELELKQVVLQGNFADQCNALAKRFEVEAIVMGTKGASGLKEALIGSNTVDLMRELKYPLYVIPENYKDKSIKELIMSFDGKSELPASLVAPITAFANKRQLPIRLLHVRVKEEDPVQNWTSLRNAFEGIKLDIQESWGESLEEGLKKATDEAEALLVMVRRKQTFWERFFNISDSRKAVLHAELPMLIVPE
jgi:nucleotide-binding universal stress UspA family protein